MESLSLMARFSNQDDINILELLQGYCHKMHIQLSAIQFNDRIRLDFTGKPVQLIELREYLMGVA